MALLKRFLAFWYDFIVGDDWLVAVGVVVLLAAAGALAQVALLTTAWLLVPVGVLIILAISLRRATAQAAHG